MRLEAEARALAEMLKGAFPNVEVGPLGAGTAVEDSWSRSIKLVPACSKGWVEVDATWEKGADRTAADACRHDGREGEASALQGRIDALVIN